MLARWLHMSMALIVRIDNLERCLVVIHRKVIEGLFSSLRLERDNFPGILKLLRNDYTNLSEAYESSCKWWTLNDFKDIFEWALTLPPIYRDLVLSNGCLENMNVPEAKGMVRMAGIQWDIERDILSLKSENLRMILKGEALDASNDWCLHVPKSIATSKFLAEIDLPKQMTVACIREEYPLRARLINSLIRQIPTAKRSSLMRLLLNLKVLGRSGPCKLHQAFKEQFCKGPSDKVHSFISAKLFDCEWTLEEDSTVVMTGYLATREIPSTDLALFLQLWLQLSPIRDIIAALSLYPPETQIVESYELIGLFVALFPHSLHTCRLFFQILQLDYDEFALQMPTDLWIKNEINFMQMSPAWRRRYYHKKVRVPTNIETTGLPSIDPMRGSSVETAFDMVERECLAMIDDMQKYSVSKIASVSIVRPRITLSEDDLEQLVDVMIFSLIVLDKPVALLDSEYCAMLKGSTESIEEFCKCDFFSLTGCNTNDCSEIMGTYEDFRQIAEERVNQQKKTISFIYDDWKLQHIRPGRDLCSILSDGSFK